MKIVQIVTRSDTVGGPHILIRDTSMSLLKDDHDVVVLIGQNGEGPFREDLIQNKVPFRPLRYLVRPIKPSYEPRGVLEIRSHLKEISPDVVLTHSSKAGWLGRIAGWSLGIPTIFTVHGWAFTTGIPMVEKMVYALAEKLVAPFTTHFITVSNYDYRLGLRHGIARPSQFSVVHNGVPDVSLSLRCNPALDPPRMIMVARFEKQKDHATLLKALEGLKHLPWTLDLVGEGPLRPAMEKLAKDLGLEERIHFLGFRTDVASLLSQSQIFLLISLWEGFPCSILEAMRAGLPVIVSDAGGSRETLIDEKTGFLVPCKKVKPLQDRLSQLLQSSSLRMEMGIESRKLYEEKFTFQHMYEKICQVLQKVGKKK